MWCALCYPPSAVRETLLLKFFSPSFRPLKELTMHGVTMVLLSIVASFVPCAAWKSPVKPCADTRHALQLRSTRLPPHHRRRRPSPAAGSGHRARQLRP